VKKRTENNSSNRAASRLKDVADALGLSISTVSAALQNRKDISETTRRRVTRKAKELDYRPNWVARSLVINRTHILGVVLPDLSRSFFPQILQGIDSVARTSGFHLVVCSTEEDPTREDDEISTLIGKQVDGLIVASARPPGTNGFWKSLTKSGVPLVLVDRIFKAVPGVGVDDEHVGNLATIHLLQQGYRNIAHLSRCSVVTGIGRRRGYVSALRDSGIRVRQDYILEVQGETGGFEGTKKLLTMHPRPDAIFAAGDRIAIGAMEAIRAAGLRLPTDVGVIGVGKVAYGEYLRVPLSTVDQHPADMGKTAVSILLDVIRGKTPPSDPIFLDPTLIVRDSSCRIPSPSK
jgi:LacI family transcriptional regulator